ncbi:glycosyltransferase family 4 protein [Lutibaculum baratangense]|uniref:Glycosyltransferase n=1 Tax=Lutibaculum baratangense AMV1 TaxID=631454 RepID=V4T954_9HYPH|nr:glycosyltransferase family 4 protein [Lutibaculum baratangense]ESR23063.1 Glycosyltransferase [Lutibaculum baratangense AMV1]
MIVENLPVPFDRRVWQEARTLRAAGAHVEIICPKGRGCDESYEILEGIHVHRHILPRDGTTPLSFAWEYLVALFFETMLAWRIFLTRGFDVIQGCNPPDLIFLVALPFRIFGVRYIFDHHDLNPELYEAKFGRRDMFFRILTMLERITFRVADVSIATNASYRRIAIERGGMNPSRVFVVRSGPDISRIRPCAPNAVWRNGRRHLVAYVGVMGQQEGLDLLVEAVRHLVFARGRTDVQFCLVGTGPVVDDLQELARSKGVSPFVTFAGRLSDDELFEVLATADVCVNPDRVNAMNDKSTMNKIIEYMAAGKPIVQFDVTEGRVSAEDASLYARPNDPIDMAEKLLVLIDDPEQRAVMGALGRQRVETALSWEHQIPSLLEAYARSMALDQELSAAQAGLKMKA